MCGSIYLFISSEPAGSEIGRGTTGSLRSGPHTVAAAFFLTLNGRGGSKVTIRIFKKVVIQNDNSYGLLN